MTLSFVHPTGTICQWCRKQVATTVVYQWATCLECAASPKARVQAYLKGMYETVRSMGDTDGHQLR